MDHEKYRRKKIEGSVLGAIGTARWLEQGRPWAIFTIEDIVYNVDVKEYIMQRGQ